MCLGFQFLGFPSFGFWVAGCRIQISGSGFRVLQFQVSGFGGDRTRGLNAIVRFLVSAFGFGFRDLWDGFGSPVSGFGLRDLWDCFGSRVSGFGYLGRGLDKMLLLLVPRRTLQKQSWSRGSGFRLSDLGLVFSCFVFRVSSGQAIACPEILYLSSSLALTPAFCFYPWIFLSHTHTHSHTLSSLAVGVGPGTWMLSTGGLELRFEGLNFRGEG